jgi:DNA invertase Pin-like site-specific DNA recombinase
MDGIAKAKERGVHFGRKPELTAEKIAAIQSLRAEGTTVPDIIRRMGLQIYLLTAGTALATSKHPFLPAGFQRSL